MVSRLKTAALAVVGSCLAVPAMACEGKLLDAPEIHASPLCVPAAPKRVVVLDASFALGIGMDVGLPIIGAPLDRMSDTALQTRATGNGVTSTGFVAEPSLEAIVALQPDLILGLTGDQAMASAIYPQLSQLAPTLLYGSTDWRGFYGLLAGFTGKEQDIADQFRAYDARLADIRARMPDRTVSVLRITSWDFQVYLDAPQTYAPFAILQQAGVRRSPYEVTDDPGLSMKRPDWEELSQLDGDVLLYIVGGTNDSDKDGRHEEVLANPLWQMLPAVKSGKVHRVSAATWMEFSGLASANRVLDDIERFVIAAP
ncbi:iron-siderophore ABC transporter substrate-binding protein [Paracoccus shanxieyensis]|uniref:ABC transporter substrate-binding protein n=1 Tax=Paracoccus shanxieyensis TaxID=2675752 RepID=A0A6L6J5E1_9RHOB|nr:iron-siderophore ABC transporter substrate-binding protein [Paracoccus shanxieyensis]MTH65987.1 ABC transporter substrate-binding protein [Paracoccus shanxieyensis]MTH89025.1 ABC transporter substrate-binding protein [Paracoccus shanxieyensis]